MKRSENRSHRAAAAGFAALALVGLLGLAIAGEVAGGPAWPLLGAVAGYVAFLLIFRMALRRWRRDWHLLGPAWISQPPSDRRHPTRERRRTARISQLTAGRWPRAIG